MVTYRIFRENEKITSLQFEMESVFSYIKELADMSISGKIPIYLVHQKTKNEKVTKEVHRFTENLHIFKNRKFYLKETKQFERISSKYGTDIATLSLAIKYSELIDITCFLLFENTFSEEIFVGQLNVVNNRNKYKILGKWLNDLHIIKGETLNENMLEESCSAIIGTEIEHAMYGELRNLISTKRILDGVAPIKTIGRFKEAELIRIALRKIRGVDIMEKHANEYILGWR